MSHDPQYLDGYQDGVSFGRELGLEAGIQRGFDSLVAALADYVAQNDWLWRQGDGYGGYVRHSLDDAFEFWGLPQRSKVEINNRAKRYRLKTSQIIAAMHASDGKCVACGSVNDLQVDHILPVSRGGRNDVENLQMLCQPCNSSKRDKTMDEWNGDDR